MFKKVIGALMIAAPFVALFVFIGINSGWVVSLGIFGGVTFLGMWIVLGSNLMDD